MYKSLEKLKNITKGHNNQYKGNKKCTFEPQGMDSYLMPHMSIERSTSSMAV